MDKYKSAMSFKCTSEIEALMTLGLENGASSEDIKKKYKEMIKKYHPDQNEDTDSSMEKMLFLRVMDAYDYLEKIGRVGNKKPANAPLGSSAAKRTSPKVFGSAPVKRDSTKKMKELSKKASEQKRAQVEAEIEENRNKAQQVESAERMAEIIKMMIEAERKDFLNKDNT